MALDATHDPALRSWVAAANDGRTDFPIQNLPHGVFRRRGGDEAWRGGVAIGDQVLDLAAALARGVFTPEAVPAAEAAAAPALNGLMAMGRPAWRALRHELSRLLRAGAPEAGRLSPCLLPLADIEHRLPAHVGDYTDFFTSLDHMRRMGALFQPDRPELPQFKWLPIAYHGRASTLEVSGAGFPRPWGQSLAPGSATPRWAPSQRLDYELELGAWIGPGQARGETLSIERAEQHLFGLVLLNDWSARDLQAWEAQPLGPFLSKNFLTTVSPWIVTLEALAPYRCPVRRDAGDPPWLPHLAPPADLLPGLDLTLEAALVTPRSEGTPMPLSRGNSRYAAWSFAQMLVHHASNGCAMNPGDLIGSGTQSGPGPNEAGCLMELTEGGRLPLALPSGETRTLLEDGDTVVLRAWAERPGRPRLGFGECRGTVLPARPG
jgi:fumarylacetoacetase